MKTNHNSKNGSTTNSKLTPVRFEFTDPKANTVCIAGTFNHWRPESKNLHPSGTGRWWKETALAPGKYEYCLVMDGHWIRDPLARESVPNPYGGRNSVLNVPISLEARHLEDAEKVPMQNTNSV